MIQEDVLYDIVIAYVDLQVVIFQSANAFIF